MRTLTGLVQPGKLDYLSAGTFTDWQLPQAANPYDRHSMARRRNTSRLVGAAHGWVRYNTEQT